MNLPGLHNLDRLSKGCVAMLGVPNDENSSFMSGAALAPASIRQVMHNGSANLCAENGCDLDDAASFLDLGDLVVDGGDAMRHQITAAIEGLLAKDAKVLSLGGDHAVTYPLFRGFANHLGKLNILHLDAHPDLYDSYEGNRFSNACPFARIMEEGQVRRLVQVGIRTMNSHQRDQADRFGVEVIEMNKLDAAGELSFDGPVYLSLDLDVLDPAFAPGVSHHEPGGMNVRQVIELISGVRGEFVGADIVEYNPTRDWMDMTAMVAVKMIKEVAAKLLATGRR